MIHLRAYSAYSLGVGAIKLERLLQLAASYQMPALGVADRNNLFGALEFGILAKDHGIKPLVGVTLQMEGKDNGSIVAFAKNENGYGNLIKLASLPYLKGGGEGFFLSYHDLFQHHEDLIILSGGRLSPLQKILVNKELDNACKWLNSLKKVFHDRFYLEVFRQGLDNPCENDLLNLANDFSLPLVATQEIFFESPENFEAHDALMCIEQKVYINTPERAVLTPEFFFKSPSDMQELFADLPEALANSDVIALRCSFIPEPRPIEFPIFCLPEGRSAEDEIVFQANKGLNERLGGEVPEIYQSRLDFELDTILKMDFSSYFLIVSDFIKEAKRQDIPVGPGRGSGSGSLVAWCLYITDINPLKYNLIFERFLNPERVSMPDFDIDFCQDRREEVIEYVRQKYGADRVAQIITFGKLQARAVVRDVGRVIQMPYSKVDKICKMIPQDVNNPIDLKTGIKIEQDLAKMIEEDPETTKLIELAIQLEGLYRHASTHAAGIVIGARPLLDTVPLYKDKKSHLPATQFNLKFIEQAGLIKFDFLGLKTLTVIKKAVDYINQNLNLNLVIEEFPTDDLKTYELLQKGFAVGIFQFENKGFRDVIVQMKPDRFEDLIALVALYRPGPIDNIPDYIKGKENPAGLVYPHAMVKDILEETFGVMVYQEQVMQIAQILAGYSLGQADLLRRAMGKKNKSEMEKQESMFVNGATKFLEEKKARELFAIMNKFSSYAFPKAHATTYALISYQTAYLKANYPAEFMAVIMTIDGNDSDKIANYAEDLRNFGIELLKPDINKADLFFKVEYDGEKPKIRFSLDSIANVSKHLLEQILNNRRQEPFKDIADFVARNTLLNKRMFEFLIAAGCFDEFGISRATLLAESENLLIPQGGLFKFELPNLPELYPKEFFAKEKEALGFYLSGHPLNWLIKVSKIFNLVEIKSLTASFANFSVNLIAVVDDVKKKRSKRSDTIYASVRFSDPSGKIELLVEHSFFDFLIEGAIVFLQCKANVQEGNLKLRIRNIANLDEVLRKINKVCLIPQNLDHWLKFEETLLNNREGNTELIVIKNNLEASLGKIKIAEAVFFRILELFPTAEFS